MANFASVGILVVLFSGIISMCRGAAGGVDGLLENRALIQNQVACALDKGPCDGLGETLKMALKEVIGNDCGSCTQSEKALAHKVVSFMEKNYPTEWNSVVAKFRQYSRRRH